MLYHSFSMLQMLACMHCCPIVELIDISFGYELDFYIAN